MENAGNRSEAVLFENPRIGLDYQEAARALCMSVSSLQKLVHRQEVPFVKIGRLVRFIPDDLAAWLKEKRRVTHVP
jgi:excisionase family DNA binding protein